MKEMNDLINRRLVLLFHGTFWLLYLISATVALAQFHDLGTSMIQASYTVVNHLLIASFNISILVPRFLENRKFLLYIILTFILISILAFVRVQFFTPLFLSTILDRSFISPYRIFVIMWISNLVALILSTSYKLVRGWYEHLTLKSRMRSIQLEAELNFLRSQINPHFLFNTLNNIYTLVLLKDDQAAPTLIKLSKMMRYMLYDCRGERVSLQQEVDFLRDYLDLNKLKHEESPNIHMEVMGVKNKHRIAPLLLLSIVENCFKHGDIDQNNEGHILIQIRINRDHQLHFRAENSLSEQPQQNDHYQGIGLSNLKRRLELIYPDHYHLQIENKARIFAIELHLNELT